MRLLLTIGLLLTLPLAAVTAKKKPTKKAVAHKAPVQKVSTTKVGVRRTAARRSTASTRTPAVSGPKMQAAPSSDRYKEIQDALAAKGYLKLPGTGVWDQDSQEAMRKFQADQNLDVTGKLSSRSLISLGLGPKP